MSTGGSRLGDLIAAAKEDGPSAVDRARIAEKLAVRIALAEGGAPGAPGTPSPPPAAPSPVAAPGGAAATGVLAAGGVLLALALAAVLSRGQTSSGHLEPAPSPPAVTSVAIEAPPADGHDRPDADALTPSSRGTDPIGSSAEGGAVVRTASAPRGGAPSPRTVASARTSSSGGAPSPAVVPAPRASSLAEELALVRDARAAARGGDPARSLVLLDELDRRHPDGVLHEERRAARVVALCAMGDPAASAEAARYLRELPSSVHAERVRAACRTP